MKTLKITAFITAAALMLTALAFMSGCKNDKEKETTTEIVSEDETTASEENETTTAEVTTEAPADETTTSAEPATEQTTEKEKETVNENEHTSTSVPRDNIPEKSDFNILIGSAFLITGKSIDDKGVQTPLEIARTDKSLYMLSDFEGTEMGALINGDNAYMISHQKKVYLEITPTLRKTMDLDDSMMMSVSDYTFSDLESLKKAEQINNAADFYGTLCTSYKFTRETSITTVYMKGTKLIGFTSTNLDGTEPVSTIVSTISASVPPEKISPPSDYKGYKGIVGVLKFMSALGLEP